MFYPNEEQDLYNQIDLSDSQFNQYVQKIEEGNIVDTTDPQFQSQNQLQPLIYSTLDLDYNIFLSEEELKFYKSLLVEKQSKIRQLKQKYTKKNSKALSLIEGLKRLQKKIKEISDGYKHLTDKHQQSLKNENSFRNKRLACQQRKTHLYKKLCELQSVHQNYMNDINSYEEYDEQFNYICQQNDRMEQEIERLQNRRKEVYEGGQSTNRKEQLKSNIKKLYERIKVAEKQEIEITQQYQTKRKRLRLLEKEQTNINSKNIQITALMNRIQKLKEECNDASYAKLELQNQYRGLLSQQSMLKKTIIGENHSNSSKKKQTSEKAKVVHNFKIIDTEGDEQLKFNSKKRSNSRHHNNSMQSQGQLDDLINRFERIKSKSKTNI